MSDNDGKKTLGVRGGGPRAGNVKQSFSHGRTKNVVVETKRKRVVVPKPGASGKSASGGSIGDPSKRPAGRPFRPPRPALRKKRQPAPPRKRPARKNANAVVKRPNRRPARKRNAKRL
jgi:translation initiation factor IF-2